MNLDEGEWGGGMPPHSVRLEDLIAADLTDMRDWACDELPGLSGPENHRVPLDDRTRLCESRPSRKRGSDEFPVGEKTPPVRNSHRAVIVDSLDGVEVSALRFHEECLSERK